MTMEQIAQEIRHIAEELAGGGPVAQAVDDLHELAEEIDPGSGARLAAYLQESDDVPPWKIIDPDRRVYHVSDPEAEDVILSQYATLPGDPGALYRAGSSKVLGRLVVSRINDPWAEQRARQDLQKSDDGDNRTT